MDFISRYNMLFDTHSHIYFDTLKEREDEVLRNMKNAGVAFSVQIGCDIPSSQSALEIARKYPNLFATVWYHPTDVQDVDPQDVVSILSQMETIIRNNPDNIVAVGETGLDFYHLEEKEADKQRKRQYFWFEMQVDLAKKYGLPLVIHTRNARNEMIKAIKDFEIKDAVIHCFSEDYEFAKELMEYSDGIYFGFSGIVTYKSAKSVQEAASLIPLDRLLIETDAPFLAPTPKRGEVNEPAYVAYVLDTIKNLRSEDPETIEKTVFENSKRFYGIG